ncbi:unnamed protein product [Prorocentrum cordatum]|uniref:Uncharacterized protein n=2 Tax=Prorocentrum cordatum TaxID=2364126 RepID=A0ABN9T278_9DINO|nr:unnamed protein product [Polarella glacialis]
MRLKGSRAGTGQHAVRRQNSLQPPVPLEVLLTWCPIRLHSDGEWLLVYLGDLDICALDDSGCTMQELLDLCSERLDALDVEGGAGFAAVVDLRSATPAQLGSKWWQVFLPAFVDRIVTSSRGAPGAVYVVRGGRTAQLAASRLLHPLRQVGVHVYVGHDDVKDQEVLVKADLGDVLEQMRRDETCPDDFALRPRTLGRSATLLAAVLATLASATLAGSSVAAAMFLAGLAVGLAGSAAVARRAAPRPSRTFAAPAGRGRCGACPAV